MSPQNSGYPQRWLELLVSEPARALEQVLYDLGTCSDAERETLGRQFVALVCGPRVDPNTARTLFALVEANCEADAAQMEMRSPELGGLRRRRLESQSQLDELAQAAHAVTPLMEQCRMLSHSIEAKIRRCEQFRELLKSTSAAKGEPS